MPSLSNISLEYLYSLHSKGIKPGLERIGALCELLGNPQKTFKCVIVGGTNGKGSTVSFLSSILEQSGLKVGAYYSPHLELFNERISINRKLIEDEEVTRLTQKIKSAIDTYNSANSSEEALSPTFFEFVTTMAFEYFKSRRIDIAVLEIGLGGRFDAVNIADPLLSIITNISIDHTDYLGDSIESIAWEKSGIIKKGTPFITAEENPKILDLFMKEASSKSSRSFVLGKQFSFTKIDDRFFNFMGDTIHLANVGIQLSGDHQFKNGALALEAASVLKENYRLGIDRKAFPEGMRLASIAGRLEHINSALPCRVILDGAHNPGGASVLSRYLAEKYSPQNLHLMVGIMKDKNYSAMLATYSDLAKTIILVIPSIERAWEKEDIEKIAGRDPIKFKVIPSIKEAIEYARKNLTAKDTLCITGSLYTVGEARTLLKS
jgi:dihydrofolate synthase / folylpolyglutamate synthase